MMDMSQVIAPKSDQVNSDDLIAGPMTVTITGVKVTPGQEQPVSISIAGTPKVYRPCKSMARVLVSAWGADANNYVGRSMTLYRDPSVKWGGMAVGGIRISHMTHIDRDMTMMLTVTKQNRAPHKVQVLNTPAKEAAPPTDALKMDESTALAIATKAASKGTENFRSWFNTEVGKVARATGALTPEAMVKLKGVAIAADAAIAEDPFGLPPINPQTATDTEMEAQLERESRAFAERMAAEGGAA